MDKGAVPGAELVDHSGEEEAGTEHGTTPHSEDLRNNAASAGRPNATRPHRSVSKTDKGMVFCAEHADRSGEDDASSATPTHRRATADAAHPPTPSGAERPTRRPPPTTTLRTRRHRTPCRWTPLVCNAAPPFGLSNGQGDSSRCRMCRPFKRGHGGHDRRHVHSRTRRSRQARPHRRHRPTTGAPRGLTFRSQRRTETQFCAERADSSGEDAARLAPATRLRTDDAAAIDPNATRRPSTNATDAPDDDDADAPGARRARAA